MSSICSGKYGVTLLQNSRVEAVNIQSDGVTLVTSASAHQRASSYHADYVVDASGLKSPLAEQYNLRIFNLKTHSRTIFTHMVNVGNIHDALATTASPKLPFDMAEGTLHHVFAGGWLWVIPFNNHSKATNPLCSVGLMVDPRVHPEQSQLSPEEEFNAFIARFPAIQTQFVNAKSVRPWVRTGRIQYSSKQVVGDRWALLGQAAGFVDPLFSKGLYTSLTCVSVLADLLLHAQQDGDYSRQRFQPLEDKTIAFIDTNDRLVASAYKAFNDHSLWHSYSVLWLLGAYTELVKLMHTRVAASASGNHAKYCRETASLELAGGGFEEFKTLVDCIDARLDSMVITDPVQIRETTAFIQHTLAEVAWLPQAFRDVLGGKTYLPRRKLRAGLLRPEQGFMGTGRYRQHFFGTTDVPTLIGRFVREKVRYSRRKLPRRHAVR